MFYCCLTDYDLRLQKIATTADHCEPRFTRKTATGGHVMLVTEST